MPCHAYLVVICDRKTNAILDVAIWSSPEWEQSRTLDEPTYVAFMVGGKTFHEAQESLLSCISHPDNRYYALWQRFIQSDSGRKCLVESHNRQKRLIAQAIKGLRYIGRFDERTDPHPLDCNLAGRISRVFGVGMNSAIALCREFGQDPAHLEQHPDEEHA